MGSWVDLTIEDKARLRRWVTSSLKPARQQLSIRVWAGRRHSLPRRCSSLCLPRAQDKPKKQDLQPDHVVQLPVSVANDRHSLARLRCNLQAGAFGCSA